MQRPERRASEGGHGQDEGGHKEQRGQTRRGRDPATPHRPHRASPRAEVCPQCGFSRRALRVFERSAKPRRLADQLSLPAGPLSSLSRGREEEARAQADQTEQTAPKPDRRQSQCRQPTLTGTRTEEEPGTRKTLCQHPMMEPSTLVDIIAQIIVARTYESYYVGYVLSEVR